MKVLVGGTYRDYRRWLRDNNAPERDAIWADTPEKLMGLELKESDVVRLGLLSDVMYDMLKTRIR